MGVNVPKEGEGTIDTSTIKGLTEALNHLDSAFAEFEAKSCDIFGKTGFSDVRELRARAKSGAHQLVQYLSRLEKKSNPDLANFIQVRVQQLLGFETALMGLMAEQIEAARFRSTATGKLDAHEMVSMPRWTMDLAEQIRQTLGRHGRKMQMGDLLAASLRFVSLHLRAFEATPLVLGRPDAVYGSLDVIETTPNSSEPIVEAKPFNVKRSRILKTSNIINEHKHKNAKTPEAATSAAKKARTVTKGDSSRRTGKPALSRKK